ncbi:Fumarate hydratase class II [uncultured archaeon]|nr:Fumarate hydratase class II [uncultured archaeon]
MVRKERDFLGEVEVPEDVYWGVFTKRAAGNFTLSGRKARPVLIHALGRIKEAAAQVHGELGQLPANKAQAIEQAAREVAEGKFDDQFPLDAIQAGAGTPFNMNCNEVIANRALEILGRGRGDYDYIHPNNDVNKSQSSNDVIPTAIRLAVLMGNPSLDAAGLKLQESLKAKAKQYEHVVMTGRTHLQDAVPITMGQIFDAYALSIEHDRNELAHACIRVGVLGIGGTAVGTGLNTHPKFRALMVKHLAKNTGVRVTPAISPVELTSSMNAFLVYGSALEQMATTLHRISMDLQILSSGPRAGIGEIRLPEVEPGSSIMPGKINPSIAEAAEMAALQIVGRVRTAADGCRGGRLQLNVLTPLIMHNLLSAQRLAAHTCDMMRTQCIDGLSPNEERIRKHLEDGLMIATSLAPKFGYNQVSEWVKEADKRGLAIKTVILEKKVISEKELDKLLDPSKLVGPSEK